MSFSVILFGAGASLGQAGEGNPPLTRDLPARLADIYPTWQAVQSSFTGGDFESAMRDLLQADELSSSESRQFDPVRKSLKLTSPARPLRTTQLQWDLAEFFFGFTLADHSLYERLCKRSSEAIRSGLLRLATLNYDTLLFQSLIRCGLAVDAGQIDAAPGSPKVCIPHGSSILDCQASVTKQGAIFPGGKGMGLELTAGSLGFITRGAVKMFTSIEELRDKKTSQLGPPTICFIEPSKLASSCVNIIGDHRLLWQNWLASASHLAIIGARVAEVDTHLWGAVASAMIRGMKVCYVSGRSATTFRDWCVKYGLPTPSKLSDRKWEDAYEDICEFLEI